MDEDLMLEWVDHVWHPFANSKPGIKYLLIDSFTVHMTVNVVHRILECDTLIDFIVPGYMS